MALLSLQKNSLWTPKKASGLVILALISGLGLHSSLSAQDQTGASAELISPATRQSAIIDGAVWNCAQTSCTTRSLSNSLPVGVSCKRFVRLFGKVASFSANGKALSTDKISRCNADD